MGGPFFIVCSRMVVGCAGGNLRPSPLSLRDISPHCGESPFARGAKILQPIWLPCKGSWRACATEGFRCYTP